MKVTKRKNGIYQVTFYLSDGKRRRKSLGTEDASEAHEKALLVVEAAKRTTGDHVWTLQDSLEDTYRRIWDGQKSGNHCRKRLNKLDRLGLTHDPLHEVTYDRLIWIGQQLELGGAKGSTINRYFALISKALTEAVKLGKIRAKPPLPYQKESKGKLRWISREEEQLLYDTAYEMWPEQEAAQLECLIIVLVDTGCRLSEILTASRVPVEQLTLIDTKNGGSRSVPMTDRAREALPHIPMWTPMAAIGRFSRLRDRCSMPDVTLHTLRHTCASRLVQGGLDLYRVKTWLGHSSITVTQRYAHLALSNLTQGVDILTRDNQTAETPIASATRSHLRIV